MQYRINDRKNAKKQRTKYEQSNHISSWVSHPESQVTETNALEYTSCECDSCSTDSGEICENIFEILYDNLRSDETLKPNDINIKTTSSQDTYHDSIHEVPRRLEDENSSAEFEKIIDSDESVDITNKLLDNDEEIQKWIEVLSFYCKDSQSNVVSNCKISF